MIDVMDARLMQLADRIDHDETPQRFVNLHNLWTDFKAARRRDNQVEMVKLLSQMDDEFERIYHDYAAWEQILQIVDLRRKAVDSEFKIAREMKAMLTADQTRNLVGKLLAIITREVKDAKALKRISYAFSRLIGEDRLATAEEMDAVELEAESVEED